MEEQCLLLPLRVTPVRSFSVHLLIQRSAVPSGLDASVATVIPNNILDMAILVWSVSIEAPSDDSIL